MSSRTESDTSLRMETLVDEVSRWPGVTVTPGRSGGRVFSLGTREVGAATFGGRVAVTFGRVLHDPLVDARWTTPDPVTPASGRTVFRVHGDTDVERARALLRLSYIYHALARPDTEAGQTALAALELESDLDHISPPWVVRERLTDLAASSA
ncbi:luciferase family protein [Halomarina rubra]|uniref:Luciferase family protein n=1 Tax=Halomarina rubra TaxID=2071873 RepID=A0ABD6AVM1_9EURY|nr:luciferase family protein [Halomarina rubra]